MDAITHQHSENTNVSERDAADAARIIDNSRTPSAPLSRFYSRHFSKTTCQRAVEPRQLRLNRKLIMRLHVFITMQMTS